MRAALAVVLLTLTATIAPRPPLTPIQSIALPSVNGRIDHLAYDAATKKLFVAALGNDTVEVVDTAAGTRTRSVAGFHEPQGIAVVPDRAMAAVANGQGDGLQLVNAAALTLGKTVTLGDDADNVRYDAAAKTIYVGYGSGALAAVNAGDATVLGRVALPGHPESFQLESSGSRIFVNVPDARQIVVIDRQARRAIATWPVSAAGGNFPMALDETRHRLFIGCRRPVKLLVYDTQTGKDVSSIDIVGDTDDLFFDAARERVYVIGGEGFIDVLDVRQRDPVRIARITGAPGARTGLFVPETGRLYLAVPHRGPQQAEIRVFQAE